MALITAWTARQMNDDFGLPESNLKYSATIAAGADTTLTIPGAAPRYMAVIKVEGISQVWMSVDATAAVPVGATFAATSSEMVPVAGVMCREVKADQVMHFITAEATQDVSVVFYSLGSTNGI